MEIKMPDGAVLVTENPEVIDSYINMMGGKEVTKKQTKKCAVHTFSFACSFTESTDKSIPSGSHPLLLPPRVLHGSPIQPATVRGAYRLRYRLCQRLFCICPHPWSTRTRESAP